MKSGSRPTLAFALGDAAGIGSELTAKVAADEGVLNVARIILIGDRRQFDQGKQQAGLSLDVPDWHPGSEQEIALLDRKNIDADSVVSGKGDAKTGAAALDNFAAAVRICAGGGANAVCFTPFNKNSMRQASSTYVDEIGFIQRVLRTDASGAEFNVLDEMWNARVTSHVPLRKVAGLLNTDLIQQRIMLTEKTIRDAEGITPRIAVAALNPHAGDGGNFGHEDDEIIAPAVRLAADSGIDVQGPIPSDTVYLRAMKGEFDVVLSMYHDQGQIAMKLIGFDRGVTLIAGFPFWIATPAHGTAYDIAGKGIANSGATKNALLLAAKLALRSGANAPDPDKQHELMALEMEKMS